MPTLADLHALAYVYDDRLDALKPQFLSVDPWNRLKKETTVWSTGSKIQVVENACAAGNPTLARTQMGHLQDSFEHHGGVAFAHTIGFSDTDDKIPMSVTLALLGPLVTEAMLIPDPANPPTWNQAKNIFLAFCAALPPQEALVDNLVSFLAEADRRLALPSVCD